MRIHISWAMCIVICSLLALGLNACGSTSPPPTPDIYATVQAAMEQTRAVEVAVATALAATSEAQQAADRTATAAAAISTPTSPTQAPATSTSMPLSTSTPIPTQVPSPTPTPTKERLVIAETAVDGSSGDGREILISSSSTNGGRVVFLPNFVQSQITSPMVFGNYVTARVAVFDNRRNSRQDGNGIRRVIFDVTTPLGDTYARTEESAPYCLFGGNDPACPGIDVRRQPDEWPDGQYSAAITLEAQDGLTSFWNWTFCVHTCNFIAPPHIEFAEIGRNSLDRVVNGELVFHVIAYQESVGVDDGDGIDYVDFFIYGPDDDNQRVWQNREQNAAFCAFGGDTPCPGATIDTPGRYRLVAVAVAEGGRQSRAEIEITVQ